MALKTFGAFTAGVAVGWIARSSVGSTREALVRGIVIASTLRDKARRAFAEQAEWAEDMFAEGRAFYEAARTPSFDDSAPPEMKGARPAERAA